MRRPSVSSSTATGKRPRPSSTEEVNPKQKKGKEKEHAPETDSDGEGIEAVALAVEEESGEPDTEGDEPVEFTEEDDEALVTWLAKAEDRSWLRETVFVHLSTSRVRLLSFLPFSFPIPRPLLTFLYV